MSMIDKEKNSYILKRSYGTTRTVQDILLDMILKYAEADMNSCIQKKESIENMGSFLIKEENN